MTLRVMSLNSLYIVFEKELSHIKKRTTWHWIDFSASHIRHRPAGGTKINNPSNSAVDCICVDISNWACLLRLIQRLCTQGFSFGRIYEEEICCFAALFNDLYTIV
jgi:hypothetical protein